MMARALALLRLLTRSGGHQSMRTAPPTRPGHRRRAARAAVWSGVAAFALSLAGLAAAIETVAPEWRDPEFELSLKKIRKWQQDRPARPLVAVFGSSRTQMGVAPGVMGFPDEPGSPVVYNLGYRAAHPLGAWLQLQRLLDAGVKPAAVVVQTSWIEIGVGGPAEKQFWGWRYRLSRGDLRRAEPYSHDKDTLPRQWAAGRLSGWATYREPILSAFLPSWQPPLRRLDFVWERADEYGFTPYHSTTLGPEHRKASMEAAKKAHAHAFRGRPPGASSDQALRDLVARCRAEGIPVAFAWVPESPTYRSWFSPAAVAGEAEYHRTLTADLGVTVFPRPDHMTDDDFVDGYHTIRPGAEKYSRWLADAHLRPWFATLWSVR